VPELLLEREFIYGLDYIDEHVAEYAEDGVVRWVIQDANYNVVGTAYGSGGVAHQQYSYEPYGILFAAEETHAATPIDFASDPELIESHFGYQGLWCDLELGLCNNRGRILNLDLGRPNQRDPNGLGLVLVGSLAMHGEPMSPSASIAGNDQYSDGLSPFEHLRSNPVTGHDPTGMYAEFDWFAETEELSDDFTAHKLYALSEINEKARWASMGLKTASEIALSLIPGYGTYEAMQAVEIIRSGRGGLMDYLTVGLGGISQIGYAIKAAKFLNRARLWSARGNRAARFVGTYKGFTRGNFRHNLKVRTGIDPGSTVHAHHVLPKEFADRFSARGINVHDPKYGAWWAQHDHLSVHRRGYNDRWREFFRRNPTAAELLQFGSDLALEYGFEIGFLP